MHGRTRMRLAGGLAGALLAAAALPAPAFSQGPQTQGQAARAPAGGPDTAALERRNQWTVGVAGGALTDPATAFAAEIARVLDDGDNLHVLPIVAAGPAANVDDLLALRSIDAAVTQSDVFEYFRSERGTAGLDGRVGYVIRLPVAALHVLARTDVAALDDLRGRAVDLGAAGGAADVTGTLVLKRLGIAVDTLHLDDHAALEKLRSGSLAALIRVVEKPYDPLAAVPVDAALHLVPVPLTGDLGDLYVSDKFTAADYPALVAPDRATATLAVPRMLAVADWPKGSERYRRVQRFVEALFNKFEQLKMPTTSGWGDLSLAASVPGWTRFAVAEDMVQKFREAQALGEPVASAFPAFLKDRHPEGIEPSSDARALFDEFKQWQKTRGGR